MNLQMTLLLHSILKHIIPLEDLDEINKESEFNKDVGNLKLNRSSEGYNRFAKKTIDLEKDGTKY